MRKSWSLCTSSVTRVTETESTISWIRGSATSVFAARNASGSGTARIGRMKTRAISKPAAAAPSASAGAARTSASIPSE
ncbi:MAG: hypothetical protein EHM19_12320 [Candidatus Latescibacterota bacterium]|nr:MAG: hypothetical protein EHM19_12320 [Candidatus Latescibacterota bacterium]